MMPRQPAGVEIRSWRLDVGVALAVLQFSNFQPPISKPGAKSGRVFWKMRAQPSWLVSPLLVPGSGDFCLLYLTHY